jgi:hypothetical protein
MILGCALAAVASAQDEDEKANLSPDKKWAYRLVDGSPAIVRAETDHVVLNLADEGNSLQAETAKRSRS